MAEKLVIHHDSAEFDENGAIKEQARPVKSKKKKMMEVNETQISKSLSPPFSSLILPRDNFSSWAILKT